MTGHRHHLRQFGGIFPGKMYLWILLANVVIFELQSRLGPMFFQKYALSANGLREGHWYQLLTFQFLHGGLMHLFMNSLAIFIFGPIIEGVLGRVRFLLLYLMCGVMGGLAQAGFYWVTRHDMGINLVGASAGAFGLVATFASFFPRERLILLLFFVIPVVMRAKTLLALLIGMSTLFFLYPSWGKVVGMGENVAHLAHLGGIIGGLWIGHFLLSGDQLTRISRLGDLTAPWNRDLARKPQG